MKHQGFERRTTWLKGKWILKKAEWIFAWNLRKSVYPASSLLLFMIVWMQNLRTMVFRKLLLLKMLCLHTIGTQTLSNVAMSKMTLILNKLYMALWPPASVSVGFWWFWHEDLHIFRNGRKSRLVSKSGIENPSTANRGVFVFIS